MAHAGTRVWVTMLLWTAAMTLAHSSSAEILREWRFENNAAVSVWRAAEPVQRKECSERTMLVEPEGQSVKLVSPRFELKTTPTQCVLIDLSCDTEGLLTLFYSDRFDEPYGGFRPGWQTSVMVPASRRMQVSVWPAWNWLDTIRQIRIDPPGRRVRIHSIQIVQPGSAQPVRRTRWSFGTDRTWQPVGGSGVRWSADGVTIPVANRLLSPQLAADLASNRWLNLQARVEGGASLTVLWARKGEPKLASMPVSVPADERWHTLCLDMFDHPEWYGDVQAFAIEVSGSTGAAALKALSAAPQPEGPAELRIVRLLPDPAFVREGRAVTLEMEVENIGGSASQAFDAVLRIQGIAERRIAQTPLEPQARRVVRWNEQPTAGEWRVEGTLQMKDDTLASAALERTVYPALEPNVRTALTGVPDMGMPATSALVGCYYFPGWHSWSSWFVLEGFPERKPLLGYYKEGDPLVAEWQVKWARAHGIGFFIFDWYWNNGERSLDHHLHDAFLVSEAGRQFPFCLLWANHNPPGSTSEADLLAVTRYWIDHYFRLPNHLKVDGRNVMVIFAPGRIREDVGADKVKSIFRKMDQLCRDAGVGGLYLVACVPPAEGDVRAAVADGYDALSGYNYPTAGMQSTSDQRAGYDQMVRAFPDLWERIDGWSDVPYIPLCEAGWDSRPWHGPQALARTGKHPRLWQQMLQSADQYVRKPGRRLPGHQPVVFLEAWNEFGEGDYIEPTVQWDFAWLEAVRRVFAPRSAVPVLYHPDDTGAKPAQVTVAPARTDWVFGIKEQRVWSPGNVTDLAWSDDGMTCVAGDDPLLMGPGMKLNAARYQAIEVTMRSEAGLFGQVFWGVQAGVMSEETSVRFSLVNDGQWHTYRADLAGHPLWRGHIGQLRVDPIAGASGTPFSVRRIRLVPVDE